MTEMGIVYTLCTNMGVAGAILLIWYLTHKAEQKRWKIQQSAEIVERAEDRKLREALADKEIAERLGQAKDYQLRWDSRENQFSELYGRILESHKQDTDRAYRLLEREVQVSELHASLLQSITGEIAETRTLISGQIETNQFCPLQRKPEPAKG